jgi:hypothetical protein
MSGPGRRFYSFLTHRTKAQAQNSKEAFQKRARTIVMSVMGYHKRPILLVEIRGYAMTMVSRRIVMTSSSHSRVFNALVKMAVAPPMISALFDAI